MSTTNNRQAASQIVIPETTFYTNTRNRSIQPIYPSSRRNDIDEDAALARILQRQIDTTTTRVHRNQTSSSSSSSNNVGRVRTRRGVSTNQDEDAAFALRLQREEFLQAFKSNSSSNHEEQPSSSSSTTSLGRANLRAMATRAMNLRNSRNRRM